MSQKAQEYRRKITKILRDIQFYCPKSIDFTSGECYCSRMQAVFQASSISEFAICAASCTSLRKVLALCFR